MSSFSESLFRVPRGVETRWATPENPRARLGGGGRMHGGRKGMAAFFLRPGESHVMACESGRSGMIRRIWMTTSDRTPAMLRSLRLEMFWDGAERPAVSCPLGDFFGAVLGTLPAYESALFSSPEGRSFNCFVPMPFKTGMRITLTNDGLETLYYLFFEVDYTLGDLVGEDDLYFHAHARSENPTTLMEDYRILPEVRGRGRFLGAFVGVAGDGGAYGESWWGEGECKIWLDGDGEFPTLCGTGTEDWIGTGWELAGPHAGRSQGCHVADRERLRYSFYRWHLDDPVFFAERILVAMQQIGSWKPHCIDAFRRAGQLVLHAGARGGKGPVCEEGRREPSFVDLDEAARSQPYGLFERRDLWSSCAFFYLDRPESGLPPAEPVAKRLSDLPSYEESEMKDLKSVPEEIRKLERWIPGVAKMSAEELETIGDAAIVVAAAIRDQEAALASASDDEE